MWNDVVDLRDFYNRTQGQVTQRLVRQQLRALWPDVHGLRVLGLGYATPFLRVFADEAERVISIMPAAQGVLHWPASGANAVALSDETALPLADRSIDRVVLAHALECSEHVRPMLREIWRVLADGGRLAVIVPNRTGLWAQLERTPYAAGHPYSEGQLGRLLRGTMFTPMQVRRALYMPPVRSRVMLRAAPAFEKLDGRWLSRFAGVLIMEAAKQLFAATGLREVEFQRVPARARLRVVGQGDGEPAARGIQAGEGQ